MLNKLRRKIILINMVLASAVLLVALLMVCIGSIQTATEELYRGLRRALREDSSSYAQIHLGQAQNLSAPATDIPHIHATLTASGQWEIYHSDQISIDQDCLMTALDTIQHAQKTQGLLTEQRLAYVSVYRGDELTVILGDTALVQTAKHNSLLVSLVVFVISCTIFYFISKRMSSIALKPVLQAWQQQKQFIADASHELKTPLTVILANHNIIASHAEETVAQQEQWLRSTAEEAEQMRMLIDEMLVLARTDDEQVPVLFRPTDISALIEEEVLVLEPVAYEQNILLQAEIQKGLMMNTDPVLLKKLADILIDNAVKYSTPHCTVTVMLTGERHPRLSVHNFGSPIAPEDLPHLFDRFYRSDKSRTTDGHGLGLAIAQSITGRLNGTLTVTSTETDGTTFTATFK